MSDSGERMFDDDERESRSASGSGSAPAPRKAAGRSPARSRSRSQSRPRCPRGSRRRFSRSRSPPRSRQRSSGRDYSRDRGRRRSPSRSPSPSSQRRHGGNREDPDPNCCLGVFGLSLYTTERDLREVFSKYGAIADVSVVYDQQSGRSRGFAFVYFESVDDAKEAKERANGMELAGRRIRVDFSITKRPHTPTPGIYMGRPTYGGYRRWDYYDRGYDRGSDDREYYGREYYGRSYRGGGWRAQDREPVYRRRSPSPYYTHGRYTSRSRSPSYSPPRY
ncbi:transformer-2 protein homolog beta-like [Dipodomys spectabilis]|uniref:transformer-2 protein homolog beta-like n=1 Tax=Dipodomys spectabilis TaxID=105255 RepID=UPI001C53BEC7|nr:transformer-2 protein homolog beta-like [Dipodomys spectabilis]